MSQSNPTSESADPVSLGDEKQVVEILGQSVLGLWEVVNNLILIGPMWAELVGWARTYLLRPEFQLASPADVEIPRCVNTAEEAIALIRKRHEQWIAESARPPDQAD